MQMRLLLVEFIKYFFLVAGHKVHFIALYGANNNIVQLGKNKCFSCVAHDFFLLEDQKMDLFVPHGAIKCTL